METYCVYLKKNSTILAINNGAAPLMEYQILLFCYVNAQFTLNIRQNSLFSTLV
jgi:hypothetical protein